MSASNSPNPRRWCAIFFVWKGQKSKFKVVSCQKSVKNDARLEHVCLWLVDYEPTGQSAQARRAASAPTTTGYTILRPSLLSALKSLDNWTDNRMHVGKALACW